MRWKPWIAWMIVVSLLAPTTVYEVLEKTSERIGPRTLLLSISARADREEPWRPATGRRILDQTLHELGETRRFYRLMARHLTR